MKKNIRNSNHQNGFKVPENYFENLEQELSQRFNSIDNDHQALSTNIGSGFITPKDYFENFDTDVQAMIAPDKLTHNKGKLISFLSKQNLKYVTGIAALLAIIFTIIQYDMTQEVTLESLAFADIENYIEENSLDFNSEDIAVLLEDELLNTISQDNKAISDDDILEYLEDEDLDNETIFIE